MERRRTRLGDVIDDYCTRCRLIMNHGVVGMVGDEVAKVRCNTCHTEHAYKHGRLPKKRRGETDRLFAEVLRGIAGPSANEALDEEVAKARAAEEEPPDPAEAEAATGPGPEAPRDESEPAHGARRKLFTIRRHSGGKPPITGTPGGGTPGGKR